MRLIPMEKYGFVYIWFDRKHNRYYIGSHWGTENDGYICSSSWMKNSYKRRPNDFKRRILSRITTNRIDLLKEEQFWLDMIDESEIRQGKKSKYYNMNLKISDKYWFLDENKIKTVSEKIKKSKVGKRWYHDTKKNIDVFVSEENIKPHYIRGRGKLFCDKIKESKKGQIFSEDGFKNINKNLEKANVRNIELSKNKYFINFRSKKSAESPKRMITIDGITYKNRTEAKKKLGKRNYYKMFDMKSKDY